MTIPQRSFSIQPPFISQAHLNFSPSRWFLSEYILNLPDLHQKQQQFCIAVSVSCATESRLVYSVDRQPQFAILAL
ncbi:hypothetical protein N7530_006596 [Penicillium desertorum]|uniref:Uncharacterized protein n=1 Tax=Penicillium desertorum TaxID=1303715 RepID=A0A9X0BMA9_9EURO|nr:hypothetical protein N7530_006596 [Penicillium desertorum]